MCLVLSLGLVLNFFADFCKSFSTHINIPKEKWNKYHEPFKDVCKKDMLANNEIPVHTIESVLPAIHFEKPLFPI